VLTAHLLQEARRCLVCCWLASPCTVKCYIAASVAGRAVRRHVTGRARCSTACDRPKRACYLSCGRNCTRDARFATPFARGGMRTSTWSRNGARRGACASCAELTYCRCGPPNLGPRREILQAVQRAPSAQRQTSGARVRTQRRCAARVVVSSAGRVGVQRVAAGRASADCCRRPEGPERGLHPFHPTPERESWPLGGRARLESSTPGWDRVRRWAARRPRGSPLGTQKPALSSRLLALSSRLLEWAWCSVRHP
jgi:hypothetical protein